MKKLFFITLLYFALFSNAYGYRNIITKHYSTENGLPHNTVYCSLKDKDGFVWFGTWLGLTSFDGNKFRTINNGSTNQQSIPRKIESIIEDKNGLLWIKTIDRKLYVFDKQKEIFHNVFNEIKNYSESSQVIKIQKNRQGEIILLTKSKDLLLASIDEEGKVSLKLLLDTKNEISKLDLKLKRNLLQESEEYISWVGLNYETFAVKKGKDFSNKKSHAIHSFILNKGATGLTSFFAGERSIWVSDIHNRLFKIEITSGKIEVFQIPSNNGLITHLTVTKKDIVYYTTAQQGAFRFEPTTKKVTKLPVTVSGQKTTMIFEDSKNKIWFSEGSEALIYYDPATTTSKRFNSEKGSATDNYQVLDLGKNGVSFITPKGSALLFDRESQTMEPLLKSIGSTLESKEVLFSNQYLDNSGILWLCSFSDGIYRINSPKVPFRTLNLSQINSTASSEKPLGTRAIFESSNGDIWVGTRNGTTFLFDKNHQLKRIFSDKTYKIGNVYHVMEDNSGNLWFSTKGDGLVKCHEDKSSALGFRFERFKHDENVPSSLSSDKVYYSYQDSKQRIWVGTLGGGLNLLVNQQGKVYFKNKYSGLSGYPPYGLYTDVRCLEEDKDHRMWIGTTDGLLSFDIKENNPSKIIFEAYDQGNNSLPVLQNDINTIYKDAKSRIWLGIFGEGLSLIDSYDIQNHIPKIHTFGALDETRDDVIMSITSDKKGNVWYTTETGLYRLNPDNGLVRSFDKYDGVPNLKMEDGSSLLRKNGEIWFGSQQGILMFYPEQIDNHREKIPTYIVDIKVSNTDIRTLPDFDEMLSKSIKYADKLTLKYNQSMFTLEFAAIDFYSQNRINYRYILEGYEKEWHQNGKNRIASYTNVPHGTYTFKVQTLDENNFDPLSEASLIIVIRPPWWQSWWAYTIYFILFVIAIYYSSRIAFFMIRMKNDIYIEQKLSGLKLKFFTNVTHELRTPLTLIRGPLQEIKKNEILSEKGGEYLRLMEKNMNQMLQLVNQILDFRKIQNGKMRLHISHIDVNKLIEAEYNEFSVVALENKIRFTTELPDDHIFIWADKEKIETVIRNLLSNAFKYTQNSGTIRIAAQLTNDKSKCIIKIEDSGIGIPAQKLTEIFERFYQGEKPIDSTYQGTGIGLALSKEIITLHKGEISAESKYQKGSTFSIELPSGKELFDPAEVDFYISEDISEEEHTEEISEKTEHLSDYQESEQSSLPVILVVEDNKDMCDMIRLHLEDRYRIYTANNGVEGLQKVHLFSPDLVVTDQMMPEMDGLEFLTCIRNDFQISHIPVIMLTAKTDEDAKTNAINIGANAYITKPFSKEYLVARIEQLLTDRKRFRDKIWLINENKGHDDEYGQYLVKKDINLLQSINEIIEQNLDNSDFNIDTIAANLNLSRSAFFKKLKSLTGLAPVDLVKEIRLAKSVEMLKNGDLSVSEIAFAVGFKDSSYYSKCFRKKHNLTPKEFLLLHRKTQ